MRTMLALVMLLAALAGCTSDGPAFLTVEPGGYDRAFDLAVEAAREAGMTAMLRDRRGGIIETDARIAGSVLEPWRTDNDSFGQALENTMSFQRRRARFEFVPAGFIEPMIDPDAPLVGADPSSGVGPPFDLTEYDGPVELRAWVYVERAHRPGLRRSTWSRRQSEYVIDPQQQDEPRVDNVGVRRGGRQTSWTPIDRDQAYERRLLAVVEDGMENGETEIGERRSVISES